MVSWGRGRCRDREALGLDVGFVLADDLVGALLLGVLVDEGHGRAELDHLAGKLGDVDHLGARNLILKLEHAALDEALALARGVVLGILRDIAVLARLGDRADDRGTFDRLQLLELLFKPLEAFRRHGNLVHL